MLTKETTIVWQIPPVTVDRVRGSQQKLIILSPKEVRRPEWRAPGLAIAEAVVTDGLGAVSPEFDTALRLAAHQHHEIRALAGLRAQTLVGDDQGGSRRRHPGDAIQCFLRNGDSVQGIFGGAI